MVGEEDDSHSINRRILEGYCGVWILIGMVEEYNKWYELICDGGGIEIYLSICSQLINEFSHIAVFCRRFVGEGIFYEVASLGDDNRDIIIM